MREDDGVIALRRQMTQPHDGGALGRQAVEAAARLEQREADTVGLGFKCLVLVVAPFEALIRQRQEFEIGGPEILTLEQIEKRTMQALGARRILVPFPKSLLKTAVGLMEKTLPNPPVTQSLLELLQVDNVTSNNAINRFVENPKAFTPEAVKGYMQEFKVRDTFSQYLGR